MKVLFAVSSESISDAIVKKYQKQYKEILSYKNVYYFNAILKEIQKDKSYDRIVISEDLESFSNNNYEAIDKFIFEKLDDISDEAQDIDGNETSIILICADRRTPGNSFLVKIFGIGIYNALLGTDRSMDNVCKLINKPRVKKEAKIYYKIDSEDVNYSKQSDNEVSELEIQNILTHFRKLGKNTEKYAESFNSIAAQYTDDQLKIVINCLPINVKAVLEQECQKYQELMSVNGMVKKVDRSALKAKEATKQTGIKIDMLENVNQNKISGPIVIPSSVKTSGKTRKSAGSKTLPKAMPEIQTEKQEITPKRKIVKKSRKLDESIAENETTVNPELRKKKNLSDNSEISTKKVKVKSKVLSDTEDSEVKIKKVKKDLNSKEQIKKKKVKSENVEETQKPIKKVKKVKKVKKIEDEDLENDVLPGLDFSSDEEELSGVNYNEEELPGLSDEFEEDDELPGLDDDIEEGEELQNFDDEIEEDEDELPGLDDEVEDEDEAEELPGFDDEFEEVDDADDISQEENDDDEYTDEVALPELDELDELDSDDNVLPTLEEDDEDDDLLSSISDDEDEEEVVPQATPQTQIESIKPRIDYSMSSLNSLLTKDKKIVTFIGTTKNGTSFLINNLAALFASLGINTAILDMTKNKNSYYIYTNNEEELRNIAYNSISKLQKGFAEGIKVNRNLTVYTALPNDGKDYSDAEPILSTLVQNHSLILIDCDFETDPSYFASCQEIYLVQSMDILTIQPLTAFLRDLKSKGVLESEKVRVVINKEIKVRSLTTKAIIGGMSFYNDPSMSFMTELFNKDMVKACSIPFEDNAYSKYLDAMVNCNVSINGYSKTFLSKLKNLGEMVYPLVSKPNYGSKASPQMNYGNNNFSSNMGNTLNKMRKNKNKF